MSLKSNLFFAIIIAVVANYYYKQNYSQVPSPIIQTYYGKVEGITSLSRDGKTFYEYLGIPYARPPVGHLRYESPVEPAPWADTLKANTFGNECPQSNLLANRDVGNEDCLFLNVYVPKTVMRQKKLVPVMVFIHGGLFVFGSSNMYKPNYIMDHDDIILVTINYRLNSFGFLNTGDGVVRGNMGLKDQAYALKWVQKNIKHFNGDPNKVTIFGESAGGASTHLQVLSPATKGLFHRAILQSGVAINPWAMKSNPSEQAKRFASRLNCTKPTTKEMVDCLKDVAVSDILHAQKESGETFRDPITLFSPTIEVVNDSEAFLTKHPNEILRSGKFNHVPIIIGYNSDEGLLFAPEIIRNETTMKIFNEQFSKVMPNYIFYPTTRPNLAKEMDEIREYYFGKNERIDSVDKLQNYARLTTDWVWALGVQSALRRHSEHQDVPVYAYYYSYRGEFQLAKYLLALKGQYHILIELALHFLSELYDKYILRAEPIHYGTGHGDELAILFNVPMANEIKANHPDYRISKDMVNLWVSFAQEEDQLKYKTQAWTPLEKNSKSLKLLNIDGTGGIIQDPNQERIKFLSKYAINDDQFK